MHDKLSSRHMDWCFYLSPYAIMTSDICNQEQRIYLKWLHVGKTLYMQVHVSLYLKYNIEKKTYTDHRAIF